MQAAPLPAGNSRPLDQLLATRRLVEVVQELSLARSLDRVMTIVRTAARELTGADGATFVLRENGSCFYAEEDAIAPLWKGRRFPMEACISGWAMLNASHAVIEDIYADPRIPAEAYRPTFVKSLAMMPIRTRDPIGAIGTYWAKRHRATPEQVELLQALADSTSVAMENIQVHSELERRVRDRTAQLEAANRELEAFSYSVSHDLRAPLRRLDGFCQLLLEDAQGKLDGRSLEHVERMRAGAERMGQLIDAMLDLCRLSRVPMTMREVDLAAIARRAAAGLRERDPARSVDVAIEDGLAAVGDERLLSIAIENLLANAWKFTRNTDLASIRFGRLSQEGRIVFVVEDNGAGFDPDHAGRLFQPFQRLHSEKEFEGTGVGLATVQRVVNRHGGRLWARGEPGSGAAFYFTLAS